MKYSDPSLEKSRTGMGPVATEAYRTYRRMGGRQDRETFAEMTAQFYMRTSEVYIGGSPSAYGDNREECIQAYDQWLSAMHPGESVHTVFRALDSVCPYT